MLHKDFLITPTDKPRYQRVQLDYDMVCLNCDKIILEGNWVVYDRQKDVELCLECIPCCPECGGSMAGAGFLTKCVSCTASGLGA